MQPAAAVEAAAAARGADDAGAGSRRRGAGTTPERHRVLRMIIEPAAGAGSVSVIARLPCLASLASPALLWWRRKLRSYVIKRNDLQCYKCRRRPASLFACFLPPLPRLHRPAFLSSGSAPPPIPLLRPHPPPSRLQLHSPLFANLTSFPLPPSGGIVARAHRVCYLL